MPIKRYDPETGGLHDVRTSGVGRARFPILTALIIVLSIVLTAGYWLTGNDGPRWGHFPAEAIWGGRYGALLTSAFLHGDVIHLVFNLIMLRRFGDVIERVLGHLEFAVLALLAAVIASGTQLAVSSDGGIGMSGVVYALFGLAWGARHSYPAFGQVADNDTVRLLLGWIVITFVLTEAGLMRVATGAHVGGLVFGFAVAWLFLEKPLPAGRRVLAGIALALVAALTLLSVTYQPWSARWRVWNASRAFQSESTR